MLPFRRASLATKSLCNSYRMASSSSKQDVYVAVSDAQLASSAAANAVPADIAQLWKQSNAKDKDTRTFYGVDGKTVVAVGVGKKSANQDENALKEQTRRAVRPCLGSSDFRECRLTTEVGAHRLPLLPTLSRPPTPTRSRSTLCTLLTPPLSEPRSPTSSGTSRRPRTPRPSWKRSRSPRLATASRPRSNRTRPRMAASDSTGKPVASTDRLRCVSTVTQCGRMTWKKETVAHVYLDLRAELCARSHGDAGKQVHADAVTFCRSQLFGLAKCPLTNLYHCAASARPPRSSSRVSRMSRSRFTTSSGRKSTRWARSFRSRVARTSPCASLSSLTTVPRTRTRVSGDRRLFRWDDFLTPCLPAAPLAFVGKGITFDSGGIVSEGGTSMLRSEVRG